MFEFSTIDHGQPTPRNPVTLDSMTFVVDMPAPDARVAGTAYVLVGEGRHVVEITGDRQYQTSSNETILVNGNPYDYRLSMMSDAGNRILLISRNDIGKPIIILGRQDIFLISQRLS